MTIALRSSAVEIGVPLAAYTGSAVNVNVIVTVTVIAKITEKTAAGMLFVLLLRVKLLIRILPIINDIRYLKILVRSFVYSMRISYFRLKNNVI